MKTQSFKEIFQGEKADSFRKSLAEGKFPIPVCGGCGELTPALPFIADYYSKNYSLPTEGIMVENSAPCNYQCKFCASKSVLKYRKKLITPIEDMQLVAEEIRKNNIKAVSLFKLGEPFIDKNILQKLQVLREVNPDILIRTSTKGMLINTQEKIEASLLFDEIDFSIDGINTEMINKYQVGAHLDTILKNVAGVVNAKKERNLEKPVLIWKYVLFAWNDAAEAIEETFRVAEKAGFDKVLFTYGGVWDSESETRRYFRKDFISDNKYKLEKFEHGYGMLFDLRKKVDKVKTMYSRNLNHEVL